MIKTGNVCRLCRGQNDHGRGRNKLTRNAYTGAGKTKGPLSRNASQNLQNIVFIFSNYILEGIGQKNNWRKWNIRNNFMRNNFPVLQRIYPLVTHKKKRFKKRSSHRNVYLFGILYKNDRGCWALPENCLECCSTRCSQRPGSTSFIRICLSVWPPHLFCEKWRGVLYTTIHTTLYSKNYTLITNYQIILLIITN